MAAGCGGTALGSWLGQASSPGALLTAWPVAGAGPVSRGHRNFFSWGPVDFSRTLGSLATTTSSRQGDPGRRTILSCRAGEPDPSGQREPYRSSRASCRRQPWTGGGGGGRRHGDGMTWPGLGSWDGMGRRRGEGSKEREGFDAWLSVTSDGMLQDRNPRIDGVCRLRVEAATSTTARIDVCG